MGEQFGAYEFVKRLAVGGMAVGGQPQPVFVLHFLDPGHMPGDISPGYHDVQGLDVAVFYGLVDLAADAEDLLLLPGAVRHEHIQSLVVQADLSHRL